VSYLPGFDESLRHFGLGLAVDEVKLEAIERMNDIYSDYPVSFVSQVPSDYLPNAVALLEVGGPDPNGLGLLGYDNSPGKDFNNLRLDDKIGGANAETQEGGFPGFGGVFIESFLFWSEDTSLNADRPVGAPPPDPLFDEIFGPVRRTSASLAEISGTSGDPSREAEVRRAILALSSMIGETSAHEVGHSLGLAQPYGSPTAYHNSTPGEGCLMDSGGNRPLGERADQEGFARTRFCADGPLYLNEIFGIED
ncbi:MAG: hypothetical protein KC561_11075, partial [Myxococcales bacterium]|nr:hypothetical protein [Myxococcales bacterium]